jgi:predicted amidohydrolase YtcJ
LKKLLFNGCIRTLDDKNTIAQSVGMEHGKIIFVGTNEEAKAYEWDEKTDLDGRLLLPGFVDSHLHVLNYAFVEKSVKRFECISVEDALALAKERLDGAKAHPLTML